MAEHYDSKETRSADERERDLAGKLTSLIAGALKAPGWQEHLKGTDAKAVNSREALAKTETLPGFESFQAAPPALTLGGALGVAYDELTAKG